MKAERCLVFKKISRSSLLSSSVVYLFSNVLSASIPFLLLPVLTRFLTPAQYGQVAVFQTLLGGLSAFVGLNAQGAASVKYYDANIQGRELNYFIGSCFFVLLMSAFVVFFFLSIFREPLSSWLALDVQWVLLSVWVSVATFVVAVRMSQWQIRKEAKKYGFFQVSQSLVNALLSLLVVVYFLQGAEGRIWVLSLVPVTFSIFALIALYKDGLLGFSWRPDYLREIVNFGVPLIPHSLGIFLLGAADRFVINSQLGLTQVGVYMVAVQLTAVMGLVFDAINNAYVPWLFERLRRDRVEEKKEIVRWTYMYCMGLLSVVLIAFLVGPLVLIWVAGERYEVAGGVIGWLALGQAFNGMYLMVTNYIYYSKRTGLLSLSTIFSGLINVSLLMVMIPLMGLKGAAIAFSVSMAFKFLLTWRIAQLRHPMPWFGF